MRRRSSVLAFPDSPRPPAPGRDVAGQSRWPTWRRWIAAVLRYAVYVLVVCAVGLGRRA